MLTAALFVYSHVLWHGVVGCGGVSVVQHIPRHLRWQHYNPAVRTWLGMFEPGSTPIGYFIQVGAS